MTRLFLLAALVVVVATAPTPLLAADKTYQFRLPEYNEPIYGTWTNEQYSGENYLWAQKWTYLSWGLGKEYAKADDPEPLYEWNYIMVEKRTDTQGNIWYKVFNQWSGAKDYDLIRISKDLNTLECVTGAGFPEESELVPTNTSYRTYRRR
jgi:hypothetical protein